MPVIISECNKNKQIHTFPSSWQQCTIFLVIFSIRYMLEFQRLVHISWIFIPIQVKYNSRLIQMSIHEASTGMSRLYVFNAFLNETLPICGYALESLHSHSGLRHSLITVINACRGRVWIYFTCDISKTQMGKKCMNVAYLILDCSVALLDFFVWAWWRL